VSFVPCLRLVSSSRSVILHFARNNSLNLRSVINTYKSLYAFIEAVDSEAPGGHNATIDNDFRSGVWLGIGINELVLSMLPGRVVSVSFPFSNCVSFSQN